LNASKHTKEDLERIYILYTQEGLSVNAIAKREGISKKDAQKFINIALKMKRDEVRTVDCGFLDPT
jgi:transposase